MEPIRWLNEKQVAALTGLSVHTLRAHRFKRTGIPYTKAGRSVRYSTVDINEYMTSHRINPNFNFNVSSTSAGVVAGI